MERGLGHVRTCLGAVRHIYDANVAKLAADWIIRAGVAKRARGGRGLLNSARGRGEACAALRITQAGVAKLAGLNNGAYGDVLRRDVVHRSSPVILSGELLFKDGGRPKASAASRLLLHHQ